MGKNWEEVAVVRHTANTNAATTIQKQRGVMFGHLLAAASDRIHSTLQHHRHYIIFCNIQYESFFFIIIIFHYKLSCAWR